MEMYERGVEDVLEVLNLTKLDVNDLKFTSQALYFSNEKLDNNNYRLLELDSQLLDEIYEGKSLYIKGKDDDAVVICSENRTFHVQEAETSNSLLLATNVIFSNDVIEEKERKICKVEICEVFNKYLETILGKPHLGELKNLLQYSTYKGSEFEFEVTGKLFTFEELNNLIQASATELKQVLDSMNVIIIDDKIRLLDFEYHFRILSYMLKLLDENSWQLDEVDYEETIESLTDLVPREITSIMFDKYLEESKVIDGLQLYRYKESEVCKFLAQVLLHGTGKFNLNEFLQAWKESVPEGMNPKEELLYGIAIIDRKRNPHVIWAFDENNLPDDIHQRFKILFEAKEKWTVAEITPYIRRLASEKVDVNGLLAKNARASKVDGLKYYSAKHGK